MLRCNSGRVHPTGRRAKRRLDRVLLPTHRESAQERLQPAGLREKLRFPARLACCEQIPDRLRIIPQASLCFGSEVPGAACKARNIYSRMPLALQTGWSAAWFAQCTVRRLGGH
jgi:hypothetical protein